MLRAIDVIMGEHFAFVLEAEENITDVQCLFIEQSGEKFAKVDGEMVNGKTYNLELTETQTAEMKHDAYDIEVIYKVNGFKKKFRYVKFINILPTNEDNS